MSYFRPQENPFQSGQFRRQYSSGRQQDLESLFGQDFKAGVSTIAPFFGSRYGGIFSRNPYALQGAYQRHALDNENATVLDFLEGLSLTENTFQSCRISPLQYSLDKPSKNPYLFLIAMLTILPLIL